VANLYRQQHGISNAQLHNDYRKPRTFWNWCIREELTTNNPFAKVEKPKLQPTLKPALTPREVEQILQACDGKDWLRLRDKALILLLLDTGLRIHEAHKLTVADAQRETVLIRGKGGKQRVVFLSAEVRLAIKRYLKACPYPLTDESPLWWGRNGALTLWGIMEVVEKIGKRAETEASGSTHLQENLRHLEPAERNRPRTATPTHGTQRLHGTAPIPVAGGSGLETRPPAAQPAE
jgi:site-specific recombinase XerD